MTEMTAKMTTISKLIHKNCQFQANVNNVKNTEEINQVNYIAV